MLFISRYQPQDIVLETKLKPFIPEYVPAIGDIDAFLKVYNDLFETIKVPRPDGKEESLGLIVLDEPSSKQSDPHVLNLHMRYTSKQPMTATLPTVRKIVIKYL
jgi:intraflagellar transport protein 46